ncbi:MAG: hypothetical protein VW397_07420 [Candidatus Margulisiibacteriota bacterium]
MNIGIILPEIGGFSSLSIEFQKWYRIIESLGHEIFIITGKSRAVLKNLTVMNELYHENNYNLLFSSKLFDITDEDRDVISSFENISNRIQTIIETWASSNSLDLLIVENFFSVPSNLPVTYALYNFLQSFPCKKIVKHHDAFYRNNVKKLTNSSFIQKIFVSCFPLDMENTVHISSNRIIKSYLKEKCHVDSIIIPYVMSANQVNYWKNPERLELSDEFVCLSSDKVLIHFSDLLPSSKLENVFELLLKINDDDFKVVSIVRKHKEYSDYYDYLVKKINDSGLNKRFILIPEDEIALARRFSIDDLFSFSRGSLCLEAGVGFGQPIHMGIQNKCSLLFCTESQIDWLELSDLGCKVIYISQDLNDQDITQINHFLNQENNWGEENFKLMRQYYSVSFLKYLINNLFMRI